MSFIKLRLVSSRIGVYVVFLAYSVIGSALGCVYAWRHIILNGESGNSVCLLSHVLPGFL